MSGTAKAPASVDAYVQALPEEVQEIAQRIRRVVREAVPEHTEAIKYGMPAFLIEGTAFLYFAVWKKHIGMYPIYTGSPEFEAQVGPYRDKKDTLRFMLNEPIPYELIRMLALHKRELVARK